MMRVRLIFAVYLLAALAGGLLYRTSYAVDAQKNELAKINRDIVAEQENIQVLGAEWTYLTDPKRIETLAQKYLHMEAAKPQHVAALRDMPALLSQPEAAPAKVAAAAPVHAAPVVAAKPVAVAAATTPGPKKAPVQLASASGTLSAHPASYQVAAYAQPTHSVATPSTVKMLLASFQPGRPLTRQ